MTATGQIIQTEEVETVPILLVTKRIELYNLALIASCNSNLILLGQLRKSGITYHNSPKAMTMIRNRKVIAHAKKK